MIRGLQINIRGEELSHEILERIRRREAMMAKLDARISRREGDLPFDVRIDDGVETLGELQNEREQHRSRVAELSLIRDHLASGEVYLLRRADLLAADLISSDSAGTEEDDEAAYNGPREVIDGLKLTLDGASVRDLLEKRRLAHQRSAERWRHEESREVEDQTDEEPVLPSQMCANEAERHDWRAEVLRFIRDHIDPATVYRLDETDLAFGELLPAKPGWLEQEEYEERTSVGFNLERLTKSIGGLTPTMSAILRRHGEDDQRRSSANVST